jgi:hypothetical protein
VPVVDSTYHKLQNFELNDSKQIAESSLHIWKENPFSPFDLFAAV